MKRCLAVLVLMIGLASLSFGQGVPYGTTVVASASWIAQTDGIATTALYTPSVDGNYRISVWMETSYFVNNCLTTANGHVLWTSDYGSYNWSGPGSNPLKLYPLAYAQASIVVRAKSGNAISFYASLGDGCYPSPPSQPYNAYVTVEKL